MSKSESRSNCDILTRELDDLTNGVIRFGWIVNISIENLHVTVGGQTKFLVKHV